MLVRKKNRYNADTKEHKIFVGNVPYNCTQDEFYKCFKSIDGFINAELIVNNYTKISRGFGFVTIDSQKNANNLKNKIIVFKERELRFTNYQSKTTINSYNSKNNYIYITNIPEKKNREWLRKCFSNYEPIGKYMILTNHQTGISKTCGVIEIINDDNYKQILSKKYIVCNDNFTLNISRYKIQIFNTKTIY
jgi:nucleolin